MNINDAFPSAYLRASDLGGSPVRVTISKVIFENVGDDRKAVVYFEGKDKGLILNKTNANKLIVVTASAQTEEWAGKTILLYPTTTEFKGDEVPCIRVREAPPAAPAKPAEPVSMPSADDIPF